MYVIKFLRKVFRFLITTGFFLVLMYILIIYPDLSPPSSTSKIQSILRNSNEPADISNGTTLLQEINSYDYPWKLIDLRNFKYIIDQPECKDNIVALIVVHTAPTHFELRLTLRHTWGQQSLLKNTPLRLVFLLGAVVNTTLQKQLFYENDIYGDLIQGYFIDHYRNMTYKHAMGFKWLINNCQQAHVLIKVDDDSFVNVPQLLKYLNYSVNTNYIVPKVSEAKVTYRNAQELFMPSKELFHRPQKLILCKPVFDARVPRTFRSKWRMSKQEYANRYYPTYCAGYTIFYSADVVSRLYKALESSKYFWIDDVHITGTLAVLNNITITSIVPFLLSYETYLSVHSGIVNLVAKEFLAAWANIKMEQILSLWELYRMDQYRRIINPSYMSYYIEYGYKTIEFYSLTIAYYVFLFILMRILAKIIWL